MLFGAVPLTDNRAGAQSRGPDTPEPSIRLVEPDPRGGKAYELTYFVPVPREVYWRFKTDFDNTFVEGNEFIEEHRFLRREDNAVVTANRYTFGSNAVFRWRTVVDPERHRLDFTLLNPEECGQKFHYGHIEVEARGRITKVTQVAYFDFFGVFLWAHYPWSGGMRDILLSTAVWEQETAYKLRKRYAASP